MYLRLRGYNFCTYLSALLLEFISLDKNVIVQLLVPDDLLLKQGTVPVININLINANTGAVCQKQRSFEASFNLKERPREIFSLCIWSSR